MMKYSDLIELKKRMEFNMTESEVLVKLVDEASRKGEKVQKENKRLRKQAKKILQALIKSEEIIFKEDKLLTDYDPLRICTIGIDGSFYLVGGVGGKWYSPYSIVRVRFEKGIESQPLLDVYSAGIEEIEEQKTPNVNNEASLRMLVGETKALDNWGAKNIPSIVFIDGPIVDPPTYKDKDYIKDRCSAIKKCLTNSIVIGCVKRSRDSFFIKHFETIIGSETLRKDFLSDQQLFAYIFSIFRLENKYSGILFSKFINISDYDVYSIYKENGVYIFTAFYQKNMDSKILRIDVPAMDEKLSEIDTLSLKFIKAAAYWQYPKQHIPLPIELAHEKCRIREGTAEVLYKEILTKSRSGDIEDQITMWQLR